MIWSVIRSDYACSSYAKNEFLVIFDPRKADDQALNNGAILGTSQWSKNNENGIQKLRLSFLFSTNIFTFVNSKWPKVAQF